jgi:NADH-quinone oxidoreductase subunit M
VTAVVLAAIYLLWAYQRSMHGVPVIAGGASPSAGEGNGHGRGRFGLWDLDLREYLILAPILAAILFIGVYPKPFLNRIEPATTRTARCVNSAFIHAGRIQPIGGSVNPCVGTANGRPLTSGGVP